MEPCAGVVRSVVLLASMWVTPLLSVSLQSAEDLPKLSRQVRTILFTDSSTMGIYLALAIPVDLPNKNILIGLKYEANYYEPSNATELSQYGYLRRNSRSLRDLTRNTAYLMLRDKFDSYGYDGNECLLKTICEAARTPLKGTGLFGDIAHIIFTPSSSVGEDLGEEYQLAESRGKIGEDCEEIYEECPLSVMAFISRTEDEELGNI